MELFFLPTSFSGTNVLTVVSPPWLVRYGRDANNCDQACVPGLLLQRTPPERCRNYPSKCVDNQTLCLATCRSNKDKTKRKNSPICTIFRDLAVQNGEISQGDTNKDAGVIKVIRKAMVLYVLICACVCSSVLVVLNFTGQSDRYHSRSDGHDECSTSWLPGSAVRIIASERSGNGPSSIANCTEGILPSFLPWLPG